MYKKIILFSLISWMGFGPLLSQVDTVSGVINDYAHVSDLDVVTSLMTVDDATPFSSDDRVLLIQMRGAAIFTTNNSSYGGVNGLNGAGSYMFARVCNVNTGTNEISLQESIDPSFASTGLDSAGIQLIRIPFYTGDVFVNGTLTADPWDGQKGGVLVFEANGKVILDADLNVDGLGFRGGELTADGGGCVPFLSSGQER
ncbi:MAG: hypothetical protein MRZ79_25915 [Bacteroidia bacterium]|nr:hypothetical protein [Bacteroidia bacterium]